MTIPRWIASSAALVLAAAAPAVRADDSAAARQRPIEEFVDAQGTYCGGPLVNYPGCKAEGPIGNLIAFQKYVAGYRRFVRVDFPALTDRYLASEGLPTLGTTYYGSITEQPLPDGTAHVSVRLHTQNAPAWLRYNVWNDNDQNGVWSAGDTLGATFWAWGANAAQLATGSAPSLLDVEFKIVFINPAMGAPMPDLFQFYFDPVYVGKRLYLSITAKGAGELAADAAALGLGEPGDPADLRLHQVGLPEVYANLPEEAGQPGHTGGIFNNAGWPVELLEVKPLAK
jgi:hypothetical protein